MSPDREWNELADQLGIAAVADGDPTRWYEELWSAAGRGEVALPWDHTEPHPVLAEWLADADGEGRRAVVVGCGLGAEMEEIAGDGVRVESLDEVQLPDRDYPLWRMVVRRP